MDLFLWIKSLHVISIIAWMAGMLYLPRLFVYHAEAQTGSVQSETFKVMERRLLKGIINPSMIAAWIFGLWLAYELDAWRDGWFHAKFTLVIVMSGVHGYLSRCVKTFARDENTRSPRFYRFLNEVPTVLMIGIVILVIGKPF
ncbi:protoporphyrinogen oxidase HemJ [Labrenzia sp. 011]|uniref:protoporphyrinogen oxidase HemJ n=1 Tax=Labrenzia sp. 011 TaxID=2171494 RepID=UPI000D510A72|nr:protoporphyrinogen oxidase HemJ [Labrenzia sp. 011]PVB62010.1 protoporphyrinogen oxidase HemJ [Labrenzia sp. 011]